MHCRQCGHELTANQAFCPACGQAVNSSSSSRSATVSASSSTDTVSSTSQVSLTVPLSFTTQRQDFYRLGALAVLLLSMFFPVIGVRSHGIRFIQMGGIGWILVIIVLAMSALVAIPSWRPKFWTTGERFLSAAAVGCALTVFLILEGLQVSLARLMNSFGGSLLGGALSSGVGLHLGFGMLLLIAGSFGWAFLTWIPTRNIGASASGSNSVSPPM